VNAKLVEQLGQAASMLEQFSWRQSFGILQRANNFTFCEYEKLKKQKSEVEAELKGFTDKEKALA
jgi:hypothetical protein